MSKTIIDPDQPYTFSDYFSKKLPVDRVAQYFGYGFNKRFLSLPKNDKNRDVAQTLKGQIERRLPRLYFSAEIAKREVLISPVILALVDRLEQLEVRIEYLLNVSEQLKGTLDYYLNCQGHLLVIEAKRDDLDYGFTQLAVELVALQNWLATEELLYGAITTGYIWQFGTLSPKIGQITQDLQLYRVPTDLDELFAILTGILS